MKTNVCLILSVAALCNCNQLERFHTGPDEAFCGQITLGSAFRLGFSPRLQMRLRLDTSKLDTENSPGTLSTFDAEAEEQQRLLDHTEFHHFEALSHDPLAQLQFGEGRERNLLFSVSPPTVDATSILAVLSLKSDDTVEVRLLRPGRPADAHDEHSRALFGLFALKRKSGDCGF